MQRIQILVLAEYRNGTPVKIICKDLLSIQMHLFSKIVNMLPLWLQKSFCRKQEISVSHFSQNLKLQNVIQCFRLFTSNILSKAWAVREYLVCRL